MKLFREVIILFGIYFIGEAIHSLSGIAIPGNLIGMIILFILLNFHIVRLEYISTISEFLLTHMSFFFIPAGVALMSSFSLIQDIWMQLFILCLATTFITMGISGFCVQYLIKRRNLRDE